MDHKRHVVKWEKENKSWCGKNTQGTWAFDGAQHVALAAGGSIAPCKNCIKAIIKQLSTEL